MKHKRKNRIASRWIALLAALALCTTPLVCAQEKEQDRESLDCVAGSFGLVHHTACVCGRRG